MGIGGREARGSEFNSTSGAVLFGVPSGQVDDWWSEISLVVQWAFSVTHVKAKCVSVWCVCPVLPESLSLYALLFWCLCRT